MYFKILICVLIINVTNVNLISLNGSTVKEYRPCGINTLLFLKISEESVWRAKVNLTSYGDEENVSIKIKFNDTVRIKIKSKSRALTIDPQNYYVFKSKPSTAGNVSAYYDFLVLDTNDTPLTPLVDEYSINETVICDYGIKRDMIEDDSKRMIENSHITQSICGSKSFFNSETTTLVGKANDGDWPWLVRVDVRPSDMELLTCGGSIISKTAVLTAGHCVVKNNSIWEERFIYVLAGSTNLEDDKIETHAVTSIILHPSYLTNPNTGDLAILKVEPFIFSINIRPVCIFRPDYEESALVGHIGSLAGFGRTETGKTPTIARTMTSVIIPDSEWPKINTAYPEHTLFARSAPSEQIAGSQPGDSGGGLVFPVVQPDNTLRWFLGGIDIRGLYVLGDKTKKRIPSLPSMFTSVSPYYSWINQYL